MAVSTWALAVGVVISLVAVTTAILPDEESSIMNRNNNNNNNHHNKPDSLSLYSSSELICPQECWCSMKHVECQAEPKSSMTKPPDIPSSSTSLSISHYDLSDFQTSREYLNHYPDLRLLKLHKNTLRDIPNIPILPSLKHLDLSDNRIRWLDTFSSSVDYVVTMRITHLNMSGNQIETLDDKSLKDFHQLQILDLSRNPLTIIKANAFTFMPNIQYLDLSQTNISIIEKRWLNNMPNLHKFNVSHTKLTEIPPLVSKSLNIFDISFNSIHSFPLMKNLTNLSELYATHTNISILSKNETKGAVNLRILNLSATLVQRIDEAINEFKNLVEFDSSNY